MGNRNKSIFKWIIELKTKENVNVTHSNSSTVTKIKYISFISWLLIRNPIYFVTVCCVYYEIFLYIQIEIESETKEVQSVCERQRERDMSGNRY